MSPSTNLYFTTTFPTPLFNDKHLLSTFGKEELPTEEGGHIRVLEMIAFPKECFEVVRVHSSLILEVRAPCYPSPSPLFVDLRFGNLSNTPTPPRSVSFPTRLEMLHTLAKSIGTHYLFGGNYRLGICSPLANHPLLIGVDCSGLLYETTRGLSPRNSGDLLFYGKGIPIENLSVGEIASLVQPLDLLVYKGHLLIVFTKEQTIEACGTARVVLTSNLKDRLHLLQKKGKIACNSPHRAALSDKYFVLRRMDCQ